MLGMVDAGHGAAGRSELFLDFAHQRLLELGFFPCDKNGRLRCLLGMEQ
ncbi:MAG: hypothetical protein MUF22_10160 [Chitinispirillaceae bacterium]|nr:hypothetical protein [Chitinispirillaceae bacterium]